MDGKATEEVMLNYFNRTVEPIVRAIVEGMRRSFLTKTARSQKQSILYFRDPFKLVPVSQMADIADKFTRNEILSSNEIRGLIGFKPSKNPKADQLINSNMPVSMTGVASPQDGTTPPVTPGDTAQAPVDPAVASNPELDSLESDLNSLLSELGQ